MAFSTLSGLHTQPISTLTLVDASLFPASGTVTIDRFGGANKEVVNFSSRTATQLSLTSPTSITHLSGVTVVDFDLQAVVLTAATDQDTVNRQLNLVLNPGITLTTIFFSARKIGAQIRVDFSEPIRSLAATTVAANYTFTGPATLTTSSVTFTPGNSFLLLSTTQGFVSGTYILTIAANTVEAVATSSFNSGSGTSSFQVDAPAIIFSAKKVGSQVRVDFSEGLRSLAATTIAGNYTFTGPASLTTSSVAFTPGNSFVVLTPTQGFVDGTYTLAVAANTVEAIASDDTKNLVGTSDFKVDESPIIFSAKKVGSQIRVDFSEPLRSLAATTIAGNYTFTGPATLTTSSVTFTPGNSFLLLTPTQGFVDGTYILTVAASTVKAMSSDDTVNLVGTSSFKVDESPIIFSAKKIGTQVRVDFSEPLRSLAATTIASNYTFTGPAALTTSSVTFTPGNSFLLLTTIQTMVIGSYTLSVAANTVQAVSSDDTKNLVGTSIFDCDAPDAVAPVVSAIAPTPGSNIVVSQVISLNITDNLNSFRRILLRSKVVGAGTDEVVHDGDNFTAQYQGPSNTRTSIVNGYHYTVLRDGGWRVGDPPIFTVYAIDTSGNEDV